MFICEYA